jgi:hypothetical protein
MLERLISNLLGESHSLLAASDIANSEHYLKHNEFGLAVADYASAVLEKNIILPEHTAHILREIGELLGVSTKDDGWLSRLSSIQ